VKTVVLPVRSRKLGRVRRVASVTPLDPPASLEALARRLESPAEISLDGSVVVEALTALPTEHGTFDVRLFHYADGQEDHLAISCGDFATDEPLPVRVHSECFTGEVLSSLRCECADQLAYAMQTFQTLGRGLVIYLR
jgi:hypothetical protein